MAICLWPGLPGLWLRGRWSSLAVAMGFATLLNLALASSFLWPDLAGWAFPLVAWPVLAGLWMLSFWHSRKAFVEDRRHESASPDDDALFIQAQTEYLKGHREASHRLLTRRLNDSPRDLESRLLLATLLRRDRRSEPARHQLDTMRRIDGWQVWQREIECELALLTEPPVDHNNDQPQPEPEPVAENHESAASGR